MKNMHLPNYKDGSIVNLMSSIIRTMDGQSDYRELALLPSKDLSDSKNIILLIIDGLGYEFLTQYGRGSFLANHLQGKMTTVLPSTTIAAVTTFATGDAPNVHAMSAWTMYSKELGAVIEPIPFELKSGKIPLDKYGIRMRDIFDRKTIYQKIKADSYIVMPKKITVSEYTDSISRGAKVIGAQSFPDLFTKMQKVMRKKGGRKYTYAYWPFFDDVCHRYGYRSKEAKAHFKEIDREVKKFIRSLDNSNTAVIITGDHGQTQSKPEDHVEIYDHPEICHDLVLPLCGEPRLVYCYVRASKHKEFERNVKKKLGKYCDIYKSEEFLKKGYFGQGKSSEQINSRIGDYILVMKGNYFMRDMFLGRDRKIRPGNHGGASKEEMFVPLVVVKNKIT